MKMSGTPPMPQAQQFKPQFDTLDAFAAWYCKVMGPIPPSPFEAITRLEGFIGMTLYRHGQFQVQMWICDPYSEIPDHSHPDVDSLQVYVSGEVFLRFNGQPVITPDSLDYAAIGSETISPKNGFSLRVRPTDNHGATIGPRGGVFITFQEWLNGVEPQSVEMNWKGPVLNESHRKKLEPAYDSLPDGLRITAVS